MKFLFIALSVIFVRLEVFLCSSSLRSHIAWRHFPSSNKCGDNMDHSVRIIGGKPSSESQFPWLARLGYEKRGGISFDCGATIINERYVLTAAHCTDGKQNSLKVVRVGANLPSLPSKCNPKLCPNVDDVEVDKLIAHQEFNRSSLRNDIALVRLKRKLVQSAYVQPICLPDADFLEKSFFGEKLVVAGWGLVDSSSETMASSLRHVELPMRDHCLCNAEYSPIKLDETQFCVGLESDKDSCSGDSGGPLMYFDYQKHSRICYLIGVVSFGKPICGEAPSVYTNLLSFLDWILDSIHDDSNVNRNITV